jgi:hypothetical protein
VLCDLKDKLVQFGSAKIISKNGWVLSAVFELPTVE